MEMKRFYTSANYKTLLWWSYGNLYRSLSSCAGITSTSSILSYNFLHKTLLMIKNLTVKHLLSMKWTFCTQIVFPSNSKGQCLFFCCFFFPWFFCESIYYHLQVTQRPLISTKQGIICIIKSPFLTTTVSLTIDMSKWSLTIPKVVQIRTPLG